MADRGRRDDEFYVGYLPAMPPGIARFVRARIVALLVLVVAAGAAFAAAQHTPATKFFEWGRPRTFVGMLETDPVPTLLVRRPGRTGEDAWSRYLLVAAGKHGASAAVAPLAGRWVQLEGSLLYREGRTMIELAEGGVRAVEPEGGEAIPTLGAPEALGEHTLAGEIVDSKCYLGAMEPGDTKPHRACAARCIAGGIPPVFLVRDADGRALYFLLVGARGEAVTEAALPYVAESMEITGQVERLGDLLVLKADPSAWRRVS